MPEPRVAATLPRQQPSEPAAEALWTSSAIAEAVGACAAGAPFSVQGVCIDSREVEPGDLFVALSGERDGAAFAPMAFAGGAAGALVSRPVQGGGYIQVEDTLAALERLGAAGRDRSAARRCAVTGSVGKTGVTQAIAEGLKLAGPAHAPVRSFNNHIGVPLTLARMPPATARAVFELGMNHAGEIAQLSRQVRPHVAVVTTVGAVHTEAFEDGEAGVARAKAEIFEGLEPGGTAVLNADDAWFDLLAAAARAKGAQVLSFGRAEGCDAQLTDFQSPSPPGLGAFVTARVRGRMLRFPIAQAGAHWGANSLAVLLALGAMDVEVELGLQALGAFAPLPGRGAEQTIRVAGGEAILIDDSYNANPVSMHAALTALGTRATQGRRIAVLTDMLELGPDAAHRHAELACAIEAADVDLVFCAGPMMRALWEALAPSRRGAYADSAQALAPQAAAALRAGDLVMAKGSKGSKASFVVDALIAAGREDALAGACSVTP